MDQTLVTVENVSVDFAVRGAFGRKKRVHAVSGVSLSIPRGKTFGLVGESGCGKTTLANAMLGLVPVSSGAVRFEGRAITGVPAAEKRLIRRDMQMIFQDPFSSLNPRFDVLQIVSEPLLIRGGFTRDEMTARSLELLDLVGPPESSLHRHPSDFSGGQRQRIGIARALALNPKFLVCDEPVSALDVSVHAQIMNLLMDLQKELSITYLFISHNLAVVRDICDSVAVMYLGKVVETGRTQTIFDDPLHPYTRSLLSAVLDVDADSGKRRVVLEGDVPSPINLPSGCRFHTRCPCAGESCDTREHELLKAGEDHYVSCRHFL